MGRHQSDKHVKQEERGGIARLKAERTTDLMNGRGGDGIRPHVSNDVLNKPNARWTPS